MADELPKGGPTPTEAIFFFNIVQNMKNKGDIDWDAVASSSGFKNAGVAKVRFGQIRRKYGLESESPTKKAGADVVSPSTPTKVTKRAAGGGGRRGGGGGGRAAAKKEAARDNAAADDDGDGDSNVKYEFSEPKVKREKASDGTDYVC